MNYIQKPCDICIYNENDFIHNIHPIFDTNPLLTPYYREIADTSNSYWYLDPTYKSNTTAYHFFVLTTRLRYEIPLEYEINYKSYRYNNLMKYIIDIKNDNNLYQSKIDDIVNNNPNHCMFLHMNQSFITGKHAKPLPKNWVISVLPYCYKHFIDEQYEPILDKNQILININPDHAYDDTNVNTRHIDNYSMDYIEVYNKLQDLVIEKLYHMYENGIIVAHGVYDKNKIKNYYPIYNTTEPQLYAFNS